MESARQLALVFVFGGVGACARVGLSELLERRVGEWVPFVGVLVVNLCGCLLIGAAAEAIRDPSARVAVLGGLLGGFTTYSAFALLTVDLGLASKWPVAAAQVGVHVLGGVAMVVAGGALARAAGWSAMW